MAKNMLKLLLIGYIACSLSSCGVNIKDWAVIWLDEEVSIKVPSDWVLTTIEGKMVFSDRELDRTDVKIFMMEGKVYAKTQSDVPIFSSPLINGELIKKLKWEMYKNSTIYSVYKVKIDNTEEEYRFLEFVLRDRIIEFIVVDHGVKKSTLKAILDSKRF